MGCGRRGGGLLLGIYWRVTTDGKSLLMMSDQSDECWTRSYVAGIGIEGPAHGEDAQEQLSCPEDRTIYP